MAIAVAFLAQTLCELGHDVRGYGEGREPSPIQHPRFAWRARPGLYQPDDWSADLVVTAISPTLRRLSAAAKTAGALSRLVYWQHHGSPPAGLGCIFAAPPAIVPSSGWSRTLVLPPSSWAAEAGGERTGDAVVVPGASMAKGGAVALQVARLAPSIRFVLLPGRAVPSDLAGWQSLPNVEILPPRVSPEAWLARARAVLSPTRADVHPLALVEAAARGIPVVCSDLPGTRASASACGFYVSMGAAPARWLDALQASLVTKPAPVRQRPYRELVSEVFAALQSHRPTSSAPAILPRRGARARVAILADVRTWCWARKSQALQRHLSDEFDVEIAYLYDKRPDPIPKGCDLYHTFEVFQAAKLPPGHSLPFVTGITAHVWPTWEAGHGSGTVARWSAAARAFHANSILLKREMEALLKREIYYVPNGVDEAFFRRTRPRASSSRLVVGFQGKPNPRKGFAVIEEACRLAGVELRHNQRTHRDALSPEEMREFYQDLHVLAVASDMDGTPNSALEAAACGVAVVGNHIGNLPELIADGVNGRLVGVSSLPPRQPTAEHLAEVLRELAADIPRVERMGEAARATIESGWTWRQQAEAYRRMWRTAIASTDQARRVA